jgi:hypothetical protein
MLAPSGEAPEFGGADGTVETTVVDMTGTSWDGAML